VQQPRQIRTRRHPHPRMRLRKRLLDRARTAHPRPAFEHQHTLPRPRQIRRASQPIVPSPHHNHIPRPRCQLAHRRRQSNFTQNSSSRRSVQTPPPKRFPASIHARAPIRKLKPLSRPASVCVPYGKKHLPRAAFASPSHELRCRIPEKYQAPSNCDPKTITSKKIPRIKRLR
jgi:hypothetical protein